jgi:hypothetical protein
MGQSVLQDWVSSLSLKKQTVMLGAIRSCDTVSTLKIKQVTTWIRTKLLRNADPMTGFMHAALDDLPLFEQIDREFERLPLHFAHHLILALQVIGYRTPRYGGSSTGMAILPRCCQRSAFECGGTRTVRRSLSRQCSAYGGSQLTVLTDHEIEQ